MFRMVHEDNPYPAPQKKKMKEDPLSHRIIEKRRRDRMNNCLADLSRLIPSEYMKKGRGRVEKTEIIEMAIRHMKHLQAHPCTEGPCCPLIGGRQDNHTAGHPEELLPAEQYKLGFNECLSETIHFLVEVEGFFSSDSLCLQLSSHLHNHVENILKGKALKAQFSAAAQNKRRYDVMEEPNNIKQGVEVCGDGGFKNGYHRDMHHGESCQNYSNHIQQFHQTQVCPRQYLSRSTTPPQQQLSPALSCPSERGDCSAGSYKFKDNIRRRFCQEAGNVPTRPVPVFALSPQGSYYIPLTVDLPLTEESSSDIVLHPVTISVNFSQQQNGQ